jgi:hypothetical protein
VGSWLRAYWTALLLALAAGVLLSRSTPTKKALAGAAFAFLGAAITRGVDLAKERRAEAAQAASARREDLDETRRVIYIALAGGTTRDPGLVATLVNALAHHGSRVDPEVAATHVANVVNASDPGGESGRWLRRQIDQINNELGC